MQRYYQKEPNFNGLYSRNNVPTIKNRGYVINLDEYKPKATHWIALCFRNNNVPYSDSFRVEHIPNKIKKLIGNKHFITNLYRIKACNWIMCGHLGISLNHFMLKGKSLFNYTNLFSPNDYEKNDKILPKYFQ